MIALGEDIEVDEAIAPFVADILMETDLHLMNSEVVERKGGAWAADFTFPDSDEASKFVSMLGTLWPEQRENLQERAFGEGYLEGWSIQAAMFEVDNMVPMLDEDGDPIDPEDPEMYEECDCGTWHVDIGVSVSIPVSTVKGFTRRLQNVLHSSDDEGTKVEYTEEEIRESDKQILKEFEGIAGLEEFF
jgi:hypothetical protein